MSQQAPIVDLATFHIDPKRGFLPTPDPLVQLPSAFACWEEVARELPKLLVAGTIRRYIEQLPILKVSTLHEQRQLERAMMLLSYFGHAYVWGELTPTNHLPASIAAPWYTPAGPAWEGSQVLGLYETWRDQQWEPVGS